MPEQYQKGPEQYQKEIEEILKKADVESPAPRNLAKLSFGRLIWLQIRQALGGKTWSLSPGRIILASVLLILTWVVLRPILPNIAGYLAWAGLLIFIIGYGLFFIKPPKGNLEKRWRGQPLDDMPSGPEESWLDRIRRKLKK